MKNRMLQSCLLVSIVLGFPLSAHEGVTGTVKQRMDAMKLINTNMKRLKRVIQGDDLYVQSQFLKRLEAIKTAATDMTALYPAGSLVSPSEASPEIWDNWEDFSEKADGLYQAVISLEQSATGNDLKEIRSGFRVLARTCKGCHDDYRLDDQGFMGGDS